MLIKPFCIINSKFFHLICIANVFIYKYNVRNAKLPLEISIYHLIFLNIAGVDFEKCNDLILIKIILHKVVCHFLSIVNNRPVAVIVGKTVLCCLDCNGVSPVIIAQ